jgi:tRNA U34 5-methylaminomethyl-2-thiouridine-forming methyltransferase MnmC
MKRELRITEDGSHTLFVPALEEPYHSLRGAIQESAHVFIRQGFNAVRVSPVNILEIGFGTGLNALLTLAEARRSGREVYYHTVEKYPLQTSEYKQINYPGLIDGIAKGDFTDLHEAPWDRPVVLDACFTLFKEASDFRAMHPGGLFHLVYFDAFAPQKQPELWTGEIFSHIAGLMEPGGILVSYTAMGNVRRTLASSGFEVEKIQGPPGKREMIRAARR